MDPTFGANWAGIKAAGMVRGVYQFFRASEDPTAQANIVVNAVGSIGAGDLPPVADVEVMDGESGATLVANLATWVSVIKSRLGVTPVIYSAPGFWDALPSTGQFGGDRLWVANWQVNCPDTPTPWTAWRFWQYADNGTVSGIGDAVDLDEFDGTRAELDALVGPAPYAAQYVSQSFPLATSALTMTAGQTIPSTIEMKNVGSKTWDTNTHLGTTQPRDRSSVFADSTWIGANRPAGVTGTVPPGGTFKFTFDLHAPAAPGTYYEYFNLVEDGVAWFSDPGQGGPPDNDLEVQVKVVAAPPQQDAGAPPPPPPVDAGAVEDDAAAPSPPEDDAGFAPPPDDDAGEASLDDGGGVEPVGVQTDGDASLETSLGGAWAPHQGKGCAVVAGGGAAEPSDVGLGLAPFALLVRRRRRPGERSG
jgi:lysozyme